jgi:hypothetical protein
VTAADLKKHIDDWIADDKESTVEFNDGPYNESRHLSFVAWRVGRVAGFLLELAKFIVEQEAVREELQKAKGE